MRSSPERGKRGKGERGVGGAARGRQGELLGAPWGGAARSSWLLVAVFRVLHSVREKLNVRKKRRRKERRKRKGRKRKEKNMKNYPNLKIFGEKNKRQFMKLVKIIFVQERNNPNYN
jgi:hypothetical protein